MLPPLRRAPSNLPLLDSASGFACAFADKNPASTVQPWALCADKKLYFSLPQEQNKKNPSPAEAGPGIRRTITQYVTRSLLRTRYSLWTCYSLRLVYSLQTHLLFAGPPRMAPQKIVSPYLIGWWFCRTAVSDQQQNRVNTVLPRSGSLPEDAPVPLTDETCLHRNRVVLKNPTFARY